MKHVEFAKHLPCEHRFLSGAWLVAFVRSFAWLVSGVHGLFTRLTQEEGRNLCSHGSKHSDTT